MSWDHNSSKPRIAAALMAMLLLAFGLTIPPAGAEPADDATVAIIVREAPGAGSAAETAVAAMGGTVTRPLDIIGGFAAEVPVSAMSDLAAMDEVIAVTPDATVRLLGDPYLGDKSDPNTPEKVVGAIKADKFWNEGYYGDGIDVAVIDSGVVPVEGLTKPGKVINGPDLSFESQVDHLRYLDTFGHGTHIAGIIAGRDSAAPDNLSKKLTKQYYSGIAPDARIVNVKVADHTGAVDVSQVIAAIDWVVQHRNDNGMNIRVLNLSFGTNGTQSYVLDPLAYAAQVAWDSGIVVVVAAGNDGNAMPLRNPATNPRLIAVGAVAANGTSNTDDDYIPAWSSCGNWSRHVDIVAPGMSMLGLRNPNSSIDLEYPSAREGDRYFRGSGTSQSAAVVSGMAALLLDKWPTATPDQIKMLLMKASRSVPGASSNCQGAGIPVIDVLVTASLANVDHDWDEDYQPAYGTGTLEGARGTMHVEHEGVVLEGEQDIFGNGWDGASWSTAAASSASWSGGTWNGASWSGASWSGASWSGASWSGASWSGASWSGASWSGASWSGASWSGASWSGASWSGASWSGASWSSASWSASSWG